MKHRFAAGTLGTLAISLLLAYAPMAQAVQPIAKSVAVSAPKAKQQLQVLADQYYDAQARFEPINATESGDNRFDCLLYTSPSPRD